MFITTTTFGGLNAPSFDHLVYKVSPAYNEAHVLHGLSFSLNLIHRCAGLLCLSFAAVLTNQ